MELKVLVNPDDQQLLEVASSLNYDSIADLLGGDSLHLYESSVDRAIGTTVQARMGRDAESSAHRLRIAADMARR